MMRKDRQVALGRIPNGLNWIQNVEARKKQLTDPDDIRMVDAFIAHLQAEFNQDVEAAMATMTDDGFSRHWGGGPMVEGLPGVVPNTQRYDLYREMVRLGGKYAFKFTEMETERLFVGPDGICTDGVLWNVVNGSELGFWGGGALPEGCTQDDVFMIGRRAAIFMSYEGDQQVGEDIFWDGPAEVVRIDPPEVPTAPTPEPA
jgi:hypothetical protein